MDLASLDLDFLAMSEDEEDLPEIEDGEEQGGTSDDVVGADEEEEEM
ncbi:hypothetical protein L0Y40_00030 [Candidatus Wolfebacteria bacterium]|nr:hypothetical protein [Candidatus Wolfebacteria bacterium]